MNKAVPANSMAPPANLPTAGPCPDCDSFRMHSPRLARCDRCGLMRTVGKTAPMDQQDYLRVDTAHRRRRRVYFEGLAARYASGRPGRALDVGCATGEFVEVLRARGWQAQGIDSYEGFVADGQDFFRADLEHFETAHRYDLITLVHCLEHLRAPVVALEKVRSLLAADGRLLIVVPNVDGVWSRLLGERWHMLDLDRHAFHYSVQGLDNVVRRAGLRPLATETYSGHAPMPLEIRLSERGFYDRGIASIRPLRSLIFRTLTALRPVFRWSIDRRRIGDEIQLLAATGHG